MKKNLQMALKTKWFEMTGSGEKPEDYRELTAYWYNRLALYKGEKKSLKWWQYHFNVGYYFHKTDISFKKFIINTMTRGYPKKDDESRIIKLKHEGIEIREGREEWGAEKGKIYFVIKHGKRIL